MYLTKTCGNESPETAPTARKAFASPDGEPLPKYVEFQIDRHGKPRLYFRRFKMRVRLREKPGTEAFTKEYLAALARLPKADKGIPPKYVGPFVYFAIWGSNARVKIGTAKDPRKRLKGLMTGAPGRVRIYYVTPGGRELEKQLHKLFKDDRITGEWFIYSKRIRAWIEQDEARRIAERSAAIEERQIKPEPEMAKSLVEGNP